MHRLFAGCGSLRPNSPVKFRMYFSTIFNTSLTGYHNFRIDGGNDNKIYLSNIISNGASSNYIVIIASGKTIFDQCIFSNNTSGLFNIASSGTLEINNCFISNNKTLNSGALTLSNNQMIFTISFLLIHYSCFLGLTPSLKLQLLFSNNIQIKNIFQFIIYYIILK